MQSIHITQVLGDEKQTKNKGALGYMYSVISNPQYRESETVHTMCIYRYHIMLYDDSAIESLHTYAPYTHTFDVKPLEVEGSVACHFSVPAYLGGHVAEGERRRQVETKLTTARGRNGRS